MSRLSVNSRVVLSGLVVLFVGTVVAESCSGQLLFRRRRERLKAEMKWELEQKLNANLDSQVESARNDLSKSASAQIQQEAAALRASLKSEIVAMRAEADKIVAEEKQRIANEAAKEIAEIKAVAKQQVESVKKDLKVTTMSSIAKAEDNLKKALEDYSSLLENKNKANLVQFQQKTAKQFESLKGEMVSLIDKDVATEVETAIKKRLAANNRQMQQRIKKMIDQALAKKPADQDNPGDKKKKPEQNKKAMLNRVPRVVEETAAGEDA